MRAAFFLLTATFLTSCSTTSPHDAMQADVDQAAAIIERFEAMPETGIPPAVMRAARGLAVLTVTKAGFIGSARGSTGVVLARTGKGWSAPSAIGTGGLGVGFQAGVQITEFVIVLNTPAAVEAFAKQGNVTLGGNLSAAAGPVGRSAEPGVSLQAATYTYSRSQGFLPAFHSRAQPSAREMMPMKHTTEDRSRREKSLRAKCRPCWRSAVNQSIV